MTVNPVSFVAAAPRLTSTTPCRSASAPEPAPAPAARGLSSPALASGTTPGVGDGEPTDPDGTYGLNGEPTDPDRTGGTSRYFDAVA